MRLLHYSEIPRQGEDWRFARMGPDGAELLAPGERPPSGSELAVFVPGTDVTAHRVKIAARQPAELSRLAAFAIEDDLAVPVEGIHAAVSPDQDAAGMRMVYAVGTAQMNRWLALLEDSGFGSARLVPDLSVVPAGAHVDFGDRHLFSADGRPVALDARWPADVRAALVKQAGTYGAPDRVDSLVQLASWAEQAGRLTDLRQGAYARPSDSALPLRRFRAPLLLAASVVVVWGLSTALSTRAMGQLAEGLQGKARADYAAAFPGAEVPSNPAAAVRERHAGGAAMAAPRFLDTSAVLYGAVDATPGTGLVSIRYDRSAGQLRATLTYPAFGADLDVKKSIEAAGLRVDLGDTRLEDGRVVGDLVIGGQL